MTQFVRVQVLEVKNITWFCRALLSAALHSTAKRRIVLGATTSSQDLRPSDTWTHQSGDTAGTRCWTEEWGTHHLESGQAVFQEMINVDT